MAAVFRHSAECHASMIHPCTPSCPQVALLDKEHFPRDKYCGDAVCTPAIRILEDMGVLKELVDNNEAHFADAGGFVSPDGTSYIGASKQKLGQAACCAVKRINLDVRIARCAQRSGANLMEGFEVVAATFDKAAGLWTVTSATGTKVQGRVLVIADGATSKLATKLGYCTEAPKGICSRAFVEGGTHNTNFDGVCFYPKWSLPGYAAIFRHPNDELNYCYYLIPCGSKDGQCGEVNESDLARLHNDAIKNDPFISAALGPNAKLERMRVAALRLGGQVRGKTRAPGQVGNQTQFAPCLFPRMTPRNNPRHMPDPSSLPCSLQGLTTTVDDHMLIIGDAAGHIDPLTGEGIHTAMMGGRAAAQTLIDMVRTGDFTRQSCKAYERRWYNAYGHDFFMSKKMAEVIYRWEWLGWGEASHAQQAIAGMSWVLCPTTCI